MKNSSEEKNISEKEKQLILARLELLTPNLHFASGGFLDYSRDDIIKEVSNNSEIGKDFIATEMEFLRAFKGGSLIKELNKV
jgi:hypothetical protein